MLSDKYQTIFVHIPKTAGQSVEDLFLRGHGLDWRNRAALLLRPNTDPAKGPTRLAHLFAREYFELGYVGREEFDRLYRFAVVRDPYDRIVSEFNYRDHAHATIRDFVSAVPTRTTADRWRHVAQQADYLLDGDRTLLVDDILHFERLEADVATLARRLPTLDTTLRHVNASRRKRLRRADLSAEDIAFINERYADDFRLLGYPTI